MSVLHCYLPNPRPKVGNGEGNGLAGSGWNPSG